MDKFTETTLGCERKYTGKIILGEDVMSEVNYRRNGMKHSTTGKCWGMTPKADSFASDLPAKDPKPKSSFERRLAKKRR